MSTQQAKIKPPKKISEKYLFNAGLYYLQRYTASCAHFKKVMGRRIEKSCAHHTEQNKNDCYKALDNVTEQLVTLGYLNDVAYLRGMVESYRRRGLSERKITLTLRGKGLNTDDIKKELREYNARYGQDDSKADLIAARAFAKRKRLGPFSTKTPKDKEEVDKIYRRSLASMARAGFPYDVCKKALAGNDEDDYIYEE